MKGLIVTQRGFIFAQRDMRQGPRPRICTEDAALIIITVMSTLEIPYPSSASAAG